MRNIFLIKSSVFGYLFLTIIAASSLFGQSSDFILHESQKQIGFSSLKEMEFIGFDDSSYYVLKNQQGRYMIQKLNQELTSVNEVFIKEWQNRKSYTLEYAVHFYDTLYVFFSRRELFNRALYVQTIDKNTLTQNNDLRELVFIENNKGNYADFYFALSRGETKLLIVSSMKLNLRKTHFNEFYVFDEGLTPAWERKDIYKFDRNNPTNNKYLVDDFGNVSILSLMRKSTIFSIGNPLKDIYDIYRYSRQGAFFEKYSITFKNKYIRDIDIVADKQGGLVCAGLYSEIFPTGIKGSFFVRINPQTRLMGETKFHSFEQRLLNQLEESTYYSEVVISDSELTAYYLTDLVLRESGDILMVTEQFYDQNFNTFNNLIINKFTPDGYLRWQNVIGKRQNFFVDDLKTPERTVIEKEIYDIRTYNHTAPVPRNFCSYALMAPTDRDEVVVLFNDNIKNLQENAKPKNFNNPKKSYLSATHIDANGKMTTHVLRKAKRRRDVYPQPLDYYDKKNNEIIVPMYWGRKYKYLKVELNH